MPDEPEEQELPERWSARRKTRSCCVFYGVRTWGRSAVRSRSHRRSWPDRSTGGASFFVGKGWVGQFLC